MKAMSQFRSEETEFDIRILLAIGSLKQHHVHNCFKAADLAIFQISTFPLMK